jgi:hypothetical protein
VLYSVLIPVAGIELPKEVFTSRERWMSLIIEWNASTNMSYLLKNLLLLILVIFKLKCNNWVFKEIMVLNASYVCLHAFSLHRESPDPDLGRWTPHFWGGSVTVLSWNAPTSVSDIQSFLGLAGYYQRLIEGFLKISKPMTELLEKDRKFEWTPACEASF